MPHVRDQNRVVDLTFSVATKGSDVDPEIVVVCRRATAMRRARCKGNENKKLIDDIIHAYSQRKEPGCYRTEDEVSKQQLGGYPGNPRRAKM